MASRSTINPSSWRTPISDLQAQYQQIVCREPPSAVEERDPVLWREIEALRFKCGSLESELCDVSRCLEVETAMVKRMQENERWLQQSNWESEMERNVLNLIIDELKKEIGEYKSKKREEMDNINRVSELLRVNKVLQTQKSEEMDRVSELLRMNKDLQTQKSELEVSVRKLENAKKANEVRRVKQKKLAMAEVQKKELCLRIQVLLKEKSETERIMNEKMKLETENRRLEEEVKKIPQLAHTIQVLKKEKIENSAAIERKFGAKTELAVAAMVEAQNRLAMMETEKTELSMRIETLEKSSILKEKMALEIENTRLEERISELIHKNDVMEKEKGAIEADFREMSDQKSTEIERMLNETIALKDLIRVLETKKSEKNSEIEKIMKEKTDLDMKKRIAEKCSKEENSEIVHKIEVLERSKGFLEAKVSKMEKENNWMRKRMDNVKTAFETEKRRLVEDKNEKISELVKRTEILEKDKNAASYRIVELNKALEVQKSLSEDQVSENFKLIGVLGREKEALEAKVSMLNMEVSKGIQRIETEKRRLEEDKNEKISKLVKRTEILEKDKNAASYRIVELNKALEVQKSLSEDQVSENFKLIGVLGREKEALEAKVSMLNMEVSKGIQRIAVLERERKEFDARLCQANSEKSEDIQKILNEKKALEARKMDLEDEGKKMVSELVTRIRLLKKEKKKLEAKVCQANKEKNEEIERILNEKAALEEEKRALEDEGKKMVSELVRRIRLLKKKKKKLKAKVCQANEEKNEEIERILNEKAALEEEKRTLKDKGMKRVSGLIEWIEELEEEKKEMEAKVLQAKKEMKVAKEDYQKKILELDRNHILERENSCLAAGMRRELQTEINLPASMLMEDTLCLSNDAVILSTPQQNEGQKSVGMALSSKHIGRNRDVQYDDWMARIKPCKRKRSIRKWEEPSKKLRKTACEHLSSTPQNPTDLDDVKPVLVPCEKNTELNTTRCTNRSEGKVDCKWEVEQDVLDAFDVHPELCLRALCALYRQKKRLGDSTNISLSSEESGLAEFLIKEDPEGTRMKKMVAKLDNKIDRDAVGLCIKIAKQHYKQVFEIYKKKEDPVFLP